MIRFLLNNEWTNLDLEQPDLTVLDYLREQLHLRGTKEGCASGDCGACTAVLAEVEGNSLVYRNFNSCITFAGTLHGKQLITVEHLKQGDTLHAAQQAMVDQHGSQCGFCTPGFVMSLFCLHKSCQSALASPDSETQKEYLAGNLCRCTGYRPILDAASQVLENPRQDHFDKASEDTIKRLSGTGTCRETGRFYLPDSVEQLARLKHDLPDARLLGGGTDLALEVTQQLKDIGQIIYLGNVRELARIEKVDGGTEIGAATTLVQLDRQLGATYPELAALLKRFGSRQIRNLATLGGNLANASPIGDLAPVLMALDAGITLQSIAGTRTLPIDTFFKAYRKTALRPDEFIRSVSIPEQPEASHLKVYKVSKRIEDDISAVCLACSISLQNGRVDRCRLAFGGMSAKTERSPGAEQALIGSTLDASAINLAKAALEREFQPISDVRASAKYRLQVAGNLLERMQLELTGCTFPTQITDL